MTPEETKVCTDCGAEIGQDFEGSVCAACLWSGIELFESDAESGSGVGNFQIPGHQILRVIARGGMGIVYEAREEISNRHVAVKMLLSHLSESASMRGRFQLESQTAATLDHPAILPVYQIGEAEGVPFFTMKLAEGGTLAEHKPAYRGDWKAIARLVCHLSEATDFAHKRGMLHRDIKPANVLFDGEKRIFLADFGLAKTLEEEGGLTVSAHLLGTPNYLSPEVAGADARSATVASDVWSLGAVLYELLSGSPPFQADSLGATLREISEGVPPPLPAEVPSDLAIICLKCLRKDPMHRYATAGALAEDLLNWQEARPINARKSTPLERTLAWCKRNPALAVLAAALMVSLILTSVSLWQAKVSNEQAVAASQLATQEADKRETVSRNAEGAAREAQAQSLLEEARARRESDDLFARDQAIALVSESASIRRSSEARDELATLLAMPSLRMAGTVPYDKVDWSKIRWMPGFNETLDLMVCHHGPGMAVLDVATGKKIWGVAAKIPTGYPSWPLMGEGKIMCVRYRDALAVWKQGNQAPLMELDYHPGVISLSEDERWLAVIDQSGIPMIFDLEANPPNGRLLSQDFYGWRPSDFSSDAKSILFYRGHRFGLRLVSVADLVTIQDFQLQSKAGSGQELRIRQLDFSDNGSLIVTGHQDGSVSGWNPEDHLPAWTLRAHSHSADGVGLFGNDRFLATQGRDGFTRIWNLMTFDKLSEFHWTGRRIRSSKDGRKLAVDRLEKREVAMLEFEDKGISKMVSLPLDLDLSINHQVKGTVQISDDDREVFVSTGQGAWNFQLDDFDSPPRTQTLERNIQILCDFRSDRLVQYYQEYITIHHSEKLSKNPVNPSASSKRAHLEGEQLTRVALGHLAFDPISRRLLVGHRRGFLCYDFGVEPKKGILPVRRSVRPFQLPGDEDVRVTALAWSPNGKFVTWSGIDQRDPSHPDTIPEHDGRPGLHVFRVSNGEPLLDKPLADPALSVAMTVDETAVISADLRQITCHETADGNVRWQLPHEQNDFDPPRIAVARTAGTVVASLNPLTLGILDQYSGEILLRLTHPEARTIRAFDITSDGKHLVVLAGHLVQLWDLPLLETEMSEHGSPVELSPPGSGSNNSPVTVTPKR